MTPPAAPLGILHGIRVLDLSRMLSGPYCTMMLADHGAEVIKVESMSGDTSRNNGPYRDDDPDHAWAGYFVSLNRNKKSVTLDLKTDAGKAAFLELAKTVDVVVENFRPGVMERLGLSYETLAGANPKLVYAAIRGFGDPRSGDSPYAKWPSYDVVAQAMGGLMGLTGPDTDSPTKVGPGVGDIFTGMMMAFGIMAALRQAEATGMGQFVDVAMYDAMISLCERAVYLHDFDGSIPGPAGNGHPLLAPFGLFPAADGNVALGIVDDAFWRALAQAMDAPDLGSDPRFASRSARAANAAELNNLVARWTARFSKAELAEKLGGVVPFGPLNTIKDIFADPHVAARGMLTEVPHPDPDAKPWTVAANPLRFGAAPLPLVKTPPRIGEHNAQFLDAPATEPMTQAEAIALRNAFGCFATGVTVVTTRQSDGTPRGFTANSFASVSLDPPLLLVCIAKSAHSLQTFQTAPHFAINILTEDQKGVSGLFASREPDKFQQADWHAGSADMPLLDGSGATFVCEQDKLVDAGDHIVLIGKVIDWTVTGSQPLGFYKGRYFSIGLEEPLVNAVSQGGNVVVGAIAQRGRDLLLTLSADGTYSVPKAASLAGLRSLFAAQKVTAHVELLYAVLDDSVTGKHGIYYYGDVTGDAPAGMVFVPLSDVPFDKVTSRAERSMLTRYVDETRHGNFGIYQGDELRGQVHQVSRTEPSGV